jgi:hypothetical protein
MIQQKLLEVMSKLGWLEKRGQNETQKYAYVMADDMASVVREKLKEVGIAVTASLKGQSTRMQETSAGKKLYITSVVMGWTFCDVSDNTSVTVDVPGEAMDAGDKAIYKAMTGSLKYALKLNFLIPTGEDPEQDSELDKEVYTPASRAPQGLMPVRSAPVPVVAKKASTAVVPPMPFGKHKGKLINDPSISDNDITWHVGKAEEKVAANDPKWHDANVRWLAALKVEQTRRIMGASQEGGDDMSDLPNGPQYDDAEIAFP